MTTVSIFQHYHLYKFTVLQMLIAAALGIPGNKIVCRVKRLGGAFGGKETGSNLVALPLAIAANKLVDSCGYLLEEVNYSICKLNSA